MPGVAAGVIGSASVERNPTALPMPDSAGRGKWGLDQPSTWSMLWVGAAVTYLVVLYAAAGGFRGSVGS
jgi:hypothetical protein